MTDDQRMKDCENRIALYYDCAIIHSDKGYEVCENYILKDSHKVLYIVPTIDDLERLTESIIDKACEIIANES